MYNESTCFSPQTVGVIVRLEKENFQVLNMYGKVSLLSVSFNPHHLYCCLNVSVFVQCLQVIAIQIEWKIVFMKCVIYDQHRFQICVRMLIIVYVYCPNDSTDKIIQWTWKFHITNFLCVQIAHRCTHIDACTHDMSVAKSSQLSQSFFIT